jgi:hypothetical protein
MRLRFRFLSRCLPYRFNLRRRDVVLDFGDKWHLIPLVLLLDGLEDFRGYHSSVGRLQGGFDGVAIRIALGGSGRVVAVKAPVLPDRAVWLDVIEGDKGAPKRRLCRAEGRGGKEETKENGSKMLQTFTGRRED